MMKSPSNPKYQLFTVEETIDILTLQQDLYKLLHLGETFWLERDYKKKKSFVSQIGFGIFMQICILGKKNLRMKLKFCQKNFITAHKNSKSCLILIFNE